VGKEAYGGKPLRGSAARKREENKREAHCVSRQAFGKVATGREALRKLEQKLGILSFPSRAQRSHLFTPSLLRQRVIHLLYVVILLELVDQFEHFSCLRLGQFSGHAADVFLLC
jgi:hypothetical protein